MRIFAISDVHIDYDVNARWVAQLSASEYRDDVLILAGDVTDTLQLLGSCLESLTRRFHQVMFVPGNHDIWVFRDRPLRTSLEKFSEVAQVVSSSGASMAPFHAPGVSIYPLLGWYDYSFGEPGEHLKSVWMDYRACRWPDGFDERRVSEHFAAMNDPGPDRPTGVSITFSHFLPRIDLMPQYIPTEQKALYPILGASRIEGQLRQLQPDIHVYGHSHVNRNVTIEGVRYINNALGYPSESGITARGLACIHEC